MSGAVPIRPSRVVMRFDSIEEFERALVQSEGRDGFFIRRLDPPELGTRVSLVASIQGIATAPVFDGEVVWRRLPGSGRDSSSGAFVALSEHERDRHDSILAHLRSAISRMERRTSLRVPAFLRTTYLTDDGSFQGETRNLSARGVFLSSEGPLLMPGRQIPLSLRLQEGSPGLFLIGRVVWTSYRKDVHGMGVELDGDQPYLAEYLEAFERMEKEWLRADLWQT